MNFICETEKLQSVTEFSFYSPPKRIYFSSCSILHPARAGVSPVFVFFSPNGRDFILERSSSFGPGVSDRKGGGGFKPLETCPRLWPKAGQGVHFPPLSSGKLARLMLRQRDGGADGVSRWPLVAVALARRSEASDRRSGFMSRVKWFQD